MRRKVLKRNCNMKKRRKIRRRIELARLIHKRRELCIECLEYQYEKE